MLGEKLGSPANHPSTRKFRPNTAASTQTRTSMGAYSYAPRALGSISARAVPSRASSRPARRYPAATRSAVPMTRNTLLRPRPSRGLRRRSHARRAPRTGPDTWTRPGARRHAREPVEVASDADVIDAGHVADVVDVVGHVGDRAGRRRLGLLHLLDGGADRVGVVRMLLLQPADPTPLGLVGLRASAVRNQGTKVAQMTPSVRPTNSITSSGTLRGTSQSARRSSARRGFGQPRPRSPAASCPRTCGRGRRASRRGSARGRPPRRRS